jgi:hypothetical protein
MNAKSHLYFCAVAQRLGLTHVEVTFSGAGDSGNVDDVSFDGISRDALEHIPFAHELTAVVFNYDHGEEITTVVWPLSNANPGIKNMREWVVSWCENFATDEERVSWDWYNNDGGGGTINFYPFEGRYETTGYYNETVATDVDDAPSGGPSDDIQIAGVTFASVEENADG